MAEQNYLRRLTRALACIADRTFGTPRSRHCSEPGEENVFSHPNPSPLERRAPTQNPTLAPTTPEPTTAPPTPEPSPPPTLVVSQMEQVYPLDRTTIAPSLPVNLCTSDEEGNYGTTSSAEFVVVQYLYQLDTTPLVTQSSLNEDVLSVYEKAISDSLIPDLFFDDDDDTCNEQVSATAPETGTTSQIARLKSGGTRQRKLQRSSQRRYQQQQKQQISSLLSRGILSSFSLSLRRLQENEGDSVVGMSSDPPDLVLQGSAGVQCPLPMNEMADRCFVVGGGITFYGTGDFQGQADEESTRIIRETMNSGTLNDIDPDVISVRFIETDRGGNQEPDNGTGDPESISTLPPSWSWVLIGFGALFVLVALIYACNRQRKRRQASQQEADSQYPQASLKARQQQQLQQQQGAFPTDMVPHDNNTPQSWGDVQSPGNSYGAGGGVVVSVGSNDDNDSRDMDDSFHDDDDAGRPQNSSAMVAYNDNTTQTSRSTGYSNRYV